MLQSDKFYHEEPYGSFPGQARWLRPDGQQLGPEDWENPDTRALCLHLLQPGEQMVALLNVSDGDVGFILPQPSATGWRVLVDTPRGFASPHFDDLAQSENIEIAGRAVLVLESVQS